MCYRQKWKQLNLIDNSSAFNNTFSPNENKVNLFHDVTKIIENEVILYKRLFKLSQKFFTQQHRPRLQ